VKTLFELEQRAAEDGVILTAQIVVERGIDRFPDGLTYLVPEELADLEPGERVIVPLGRGDKPAAGYVIETQKRTSPKVPRSGNAQTHKPERKDAGPDDRREEGPGRTSNRQSSTVNRQSLKSILRRDEAHHRLPRELVELARWISGYYVTPLGMVMASMLPGPVKRDIGRVMRVMVDVAGRDAPPTQTGTPGVPPGSPGRPSSLAAAGPELVQRKHHLPHWELGGSTYHITTSLQLGVTGLSNEERQIVLDACTHWHSRWYQLHICSVMPDHLHMLLTPLDQAPGKWHSVPRILHSIKSFTSHEIHRLRGTSGSIWLGEYYDRIIRNEKDFFEKWTYIWENPLRAGLVTAAEDYPFTFAGETFEERATLTARRDAGRPQSKLQRAVLELVPSLPPDQRPVEIHDLARRAGLKTLGPIKTLIKKGLLSSTTRTSVEAEWAGQAIDRFIPAKLTDDQSRILDEISPALAQGFSTHLIFGVTGSGKTEVYIRLIEQVIARGKVALMLVPEIALTPQTGGRLIGRFPNHRVAVLHSGLTPAQRNQQWTMVAEGRADIILGARSAVFAPIPEDRLGLIIVDEEHDSSYKQDQQPRYHGRDVAIRRAQMSDCPILLASATPSLESWFNARNEANAHGVHAVGFERETHVHRVSYFLHRMMHRIPGTSLPKVTIVDFRAQMRARRDRARIHLIGPVLENEIRRTLDENHQALLLLNRRGYANFVACPDNVRCNWVMQCEHCDTTMVLHRDRSIPTGGFVRCHHCLAEQQVPRQCPQCGKKVVNFGLGTQRVEDELSAMFPELIEGSTMMRVDSDTMSSAASFHDVLGRFARNELKLLIGTQMIAKGLDFPNVRLVGVINADTALNLPDFRASERTFQLVNQVAGRCGRGAAAGKVVVQSFQPGTSAIQLAAKHDYDGFAALELKTRVESALPPVTRMARIMIRHEDLPTSVEIATELASRLRGLIDDSPSLPGRGLGGGSDRAFTSGAPPTPQPPPAVGGGGRRIRLRGPAPCPISRIAGRFRQQIELIAPTAGVLQNLLAAARSRGWIKSDALMAIDVDPLALL